ncbi:MAG: hypothetical protein H6810_00800 [Phycisphaeraceae bacterium]|nr:MAG: hypothetical protein H6810_00800 [Phycisphaeraceae bacterium]
MTRRFDFEEQNTNPTDLPRSWIRAQNDPPLRVRPGFPLWNRAQLDYTVSAAGAGSVRLPTRGGSASLLLDPGVVPVFPDADYVVTAKVRTDGVTHARARMVVRLLDADGKPLAASGVSSDPVETRGLWRDVLVHIPGNEPAAASLQIELLLEQPGPTGELPFEDLEVVPEDFTGAAWFDEIEVIQVPRVELWTRWPGNLVPSIDRPEVSLFLRDLVGRPLDVVFEAADLDGDIVDSRALVFDGGRLEQTWTPKLPVLGWYRVRVKVSQDGAPVGSAFTDLVWRSPGLGDTQGAGRPVDSFSLSFASAPTESLGALGDLALASGTSRVIAELWYGGEPADHARSAALVDLTNRLTPVNRELGIIVPGLPPEISNVRGARGLLAAITDGTHDGAKWLDPLLVDLGHRVRWWRLGALGEALDASLLPDLDAAVGRVRGLVPGAVLELPWSPFNQIAPGMVAPGLAVSQDLGPGVPPDEVGAVLGDFLSLADQAGSGGWDVPRHTSGFAAQDADRVGIGPSLDAMLRRAVNTWTTVGSDTRGRTLRLDDGWRWQGGRRAQFMPNPSAAAWLTLIEMLNNRQAEPLERVAPGVEGVLLSPRIGAPRGTSSIAVLWPAADSPEPDRVSLLVADGPVRLIDKFGNALAVEPGEIEPTAVRTHRMPWAGGLVYVDGVDPDLMRFAASVHAEPPLIETRTEPQSLDLVLSNPWPSAIHGRYFVVEPGGLSEGDVRSRDRAWDIKPRQGAFGIDPGETVRLPIEFEASAGVDAGTSPLVVDLDLTAPTVTGLMRIERRVEVGLKDITMNLSYRYSPDGRDIAVFAEITNTGPQTQVVHVYASATGYARQRSAPTPLTPGQQVVKAFSFEGGRAALAGQDIGVGLFIRETGARLRKRIVVDGG